MFVVVVVEDALVLFRSRRRRVFYLLDAKRAKKRARLKPFALPSYKKNNPSIHAQQVRHPNILQFRDTAEVEERGETVSER